ncbi:serine/threonine protein kinase, partial [cf. Phormidesmis sp. LEGE 11477]|nr:serine/threonine protein kinase [cf. Phormidesmis sp. LEGE 11477]
LSQIKTVAVGRPNPGVNTEPTSTVNQAQQSRAQQNRIPPSPPASQFGTRLQMPSERERPPSFFENPVAVGTLAAGLVTAAGFGGWATVRYLNSPVTPEPTITSLPPLGSEETPAPTATADPQPAEYTQPLDLTPGVAEAVQGNLLGGDTLNYLLPAESGQSLTVAVAPEGVLLSVLGPNDRPVARNARRVAQWQGTLRESGEYKIQLSPVRGVPSSNYQLSATLGPVPAPPPETQPPTQAPVEPTNPPTDGTEPPATNPPATEPPTRTPRPTEPPQLNIQRQRVTFPGESQGIRVANSVGPGQLRRYVVSASQGQILTVNALSSDGPVSFELLMPDGTLLPDASDLERWQGFLPEGGDYSIDVTAPERSEFTLEIQLSAEVPLGD